MKAYWKAYLNKRNDQLDHAVFCALSFIVAFLIGRADGVHILQWAVLAYLAFYHVLAICAGIVKRRETRHTEE